MFWEANAHQRNVMSLLAGEKTAVRVALSLATIRGE